MISVPPEILMIGHFFLPIFSKNQVQDSSSQGSPVEPKTRSDAKENPDKNASPAFFNTRTAVGEIPKCVTRCSSTICQSREGFGKSGTPSYKMTAPPNCRMPKS